MRLPLSQSNLTPNPRVQSQNPILQANQNNIYQIQEICSQRSGICIMYNTMLEPSPDSLPLRFTPRTLSHQTVTEAATKGQRTHDIKTCPLTLLYDRLQPQSKDGVHQKFTFSNYKLFIVCLPKNVDML